ncbi:MAG: single-stranded-DNA-specific exonuclease RecJ [bacterium]|nr:single-stranded-DNA-specific exonuclease RecJ [bacterium]
MVTYKVRERTHPELLQDLLTARGIVGESVIEQFLSPNFERDSHDPFLLPDMAKAVDRLQLAAKNNEKIAVWSDYDCDGIPGGVLLTEFFRSIGMQVRHYIPHRHEEGYGLNNEGLTELANEGIKLIVTVDLGTTDIEPVAHAKKKGIDMIITDHHLCSGKLPEAFALINPKRPDSKYPFDGLCGAGVAWKLVQAILIRLRSQKNISDFDFAEGKEKWLLDLVGIATLSDMVPLVGENRMLAHFGLRVMRSPQLVWRRPGFAALLQMMRIRPSSLTEDDIGFMVAPRINAASRMGTPQTASRLLATADASEAATLARELNAVNDERKSIVASTVKEVNKRLVKSDFTTSPIIVMGNPNWRPGILGLVASSLVGSHSKPTFLWGRDGSTSSPQEDGLLRGSCRSDGFVNVVELMEGAREVFEDFGGHSASGGFSLTQEKVPELAPKLMLAYEKLLSSGVKAKEIMLDRQLELAEVPNTLKVLSKLAPFGVGNTKPLFLLPSVSIAQARMFGKQQNHLDLTLEQSGNRVGGIAFFSTPASFTKKFEVGSKADIIGHIELDWKGAPRLRIIDIL